MWTGDTDILMDIVKRMQGLKRLTTRLRAQYYKFDAASIREIEECYVRFSLMVGE